MWKRAAEDKVLMSLFFVSLAMLASGKYRTEADPLICRYVMERKSLGYKRSLVDDLPSIALLNAEKTQTLEDEAETVSPLDSGKKFLDDNGESKVECLGSTACFTVWKMIKHTITNASEDVIYKAGCWPLSPGRNPDELVAHCPAKTCENRAAPRQGNTYFCCCSENNCNVKFTDVYVPPPVTVTTPYAESHHDNMVWIWGIVGTLAAAVVILVAVLVYIYRKYRICGKDSDKDCEEMKPLNLSETFPQRFDVDKQKIDLEFAKLEDELASGRYGTVYRAILEGRIVAIKTFLEENYSYFLNECRVYNLPHMQQHDSILKFLAATEQRTGIGNHKSYWLVVDYHPNKSLIDFLKTNTIDAKTFTGMTYSLASGLAFLHSEITRDGITKPGIGHRDFNSRNVLVRSDFRLCICDMGFALPLTGRDKSNSSTSAHLEDSPILNDVGTIRYMAPEILEGSLNLRDSNTALRQVDMYAFALVFWEMATRCSDLYASNTIPEYQLPFQKEAGMHPTFAQMQTLVARKKARPLFPESWKDNNLSVKFLKEIMEECWDADAEARLTANCVEERLSELAVVFDKQKSVLVNVTVADKRVSVAPSLRSVSTEEPSETVPMLEDINEIIFPPTKNINEIMDVMNKNAPGMPGFPPGRIQPHQGRNPCQERNYKLDSSEELTSSGNNLVSKKSGYKHQSPSAALSTANSRVRNAVTCPPPGAPSGSGARQKKVTNDVAQHWNMMGFTGLFSNLGRKDKQTLSSFLSHRAAPAAPSVPASSQAEAAPTPAIYTGNKKNNIFTAAAMLPQVARRDQPPDASTSTQVTCLSPSPSSSSGASPPQYTSAHTRMPRFSMINDSSETDSGDRLEHSGDDDEGLGGSPRETLINIAGSSRVANRD